MNLKRLVLFLVVVAVLTSLVYQNVKSGWVTYRHGETLFLQGDLKGALPLFEAAEAAGIPSRELLLRLTEVRLFLGQVEAARQAMAQAFHERWFRPFTAEALVELFLRFRQGESALLVLAEAVAQHPDSAVLRLLYARLLSRLGRFAEAAREFRLLLGEPAS